MDIQAMSSSTETYVAETNGSHMDHIYIASGILIEEDLQVGRTEVVGEGRECVDISIESSKKHHQGPVPAEFIEDRRKRQKCLSKRLKTFKNQAHQLHQLCGVKISYRVETESGRVIEESHPTMTRRSVKRDAEEHDLQKQMNPAVEIIDFTRPDSSRKNLFITNIPSVLHEDDIVLELRKIFEPYGLVYGVQVYPTQWKPKQEAEQNTGETTSGFYAFVTFYSSVAATTAKEDLRGVLMLADQECKIAFAKRKKEVQDKQQLYFTRCYELLAYYLGFNSWSTSIKTLFEDKDTVEETVNTKTVKYVCLIQLNVLDLKTDGVGVWQETYSKTDQMSRIQATCKCKKLCHQRAIENAFSKVLLVVVGNGKVTVEIDTTKPEFRVDNIPEEQLIKVNDLDAKPESEAIKEDNTDDVDLSSKMSAGEIDDINLHILQELEDDM